MTNSEQDPGYQTWISGLMNGTVSDAEQAMRASFRAMQAAKPQPATRAPQPVGAVQTGDNVWAVSQGHGDDALTTYTLMSGPGIAGLIAAR